MREDVSGDLSPSISFSEKASKYKRISRETVKLLLKKTRIVKRETYQAHLTFLEYQKDQERLTRSW